MDSSKPTSSKTEGEMDGLNRNDKKLLFRRQQELVKMEAAYQRNRRKLLRESSANELEPLEGTSGGNGIGANSQLKEGDNEDTLFLFPEEIWKNILENVEDERDLQSCAEAYAFFGHILKKSKSQWLFGKVFPLIANQLKDEETLKCRLVCRKWCLGVNHFLENYNMVQPEALTTRNVREFERNSLKSPNPCITFPYADFSFSYTFVITPPNPPINEDSSMEEDDEFEDHGHYATGREQRWYETVKNEIEAHPGNPFIGRILTIKYERRMYDNVTTASQELMFSESIKRLQDFGKHVWHLTLVDPDFSLVEFYKVCLQSLINCKDLRTLCIDMGSRKKWSTVNKINACPEPVDSNHLETLRFTCNGDLDSWNILTIQDKLIKKFKGQLKRLQIPFWGHYYQDYEWPNLLEVQISNAIDECGETLFSLKYINAPNLQQLFVSLRILDNACLLTLLEITHQHPKLENLQLQLQATVSTSKELSYYNLGLHAGPPLTSLELTGPKRGLESLDFLICFPFLRRLLIRYNGEGGDCRENVPSGKGLGSNGEYESINLANYATSAARGAASKNEIYKSNLWEALPLLQMLEMWYKGYKTKGRKVYTRAGYENYLATLNISV